MELLSQNPEVSSDRETKGFDLSAGKTWIYPENYPVRNYQFDIVKSALFNNTLVCLPTGLGKTFIAAVVMYNFWRWYPFGKVVFLAPTKPLVAQQISACYDIMGIPSAETIELTGAVAQKQREIAWFKKRVIFATPQVFHNDLEKNIVPAELVKCVVIDEAHKALGKHSYCECIRILIKRNQHFRVLALSATPGNKIENVHEVLQNLLIANLELRDERSADIVPYINQRKLDVILVPLSDELAKFKDRYVHVMDRHVKLLVRCNVLQGHTANISKGRIFHLLREFQKKTNRSGNHAQIMKTLNILLTMSHAYELMVRDGLRAFHKFYLNHADKFWIGGETALQMLLDDINTYLGPFPDTKSLYDGSTLEIPNDLVFGHTKFEKLKELLQQHFKRSKEKMENTRAIVFVEYREIVNEVYVLLLQTRPLIRPQIFVGQAGLKQKQQLKALEDFRSNHVNVLISTSIGEEGLDVGEVDLIICFDISQQSPTRLVQRMGRTGRQRDGHIFILVTDGKEHETFTSTVARRASLSKKILNTSAIFTSMYENNPRMIPSAFQPICHKMHITVQPKIPVTKEKKKKEKPEKKRTAGPNGTTKRAVKESNAAHPQPVPGQCSIAKFLTGEVIVNPSRSLPTQIENNRNAINAADVKLLSQDDEAVDFLVLCALKKSEKDSSTDQVKPITASYACRKPRPKKLFDFTVPDLAILDCLDSLEDVPTAHIVKNDNVRKNNAQIPVIGLSPIPSDEKFDEMFDAEESKFEEILDIEKSKHEEILDAEKSAFEEILDVEESKFEEILDVEESKFEEILDADKSAFEDLLDDSNESINGDEDTVSTMKTIFSGICVTDEKLENKESNSRTSDLDTFEELLDDSNDSFEANILLKDRDSNHSETAVNQSSKSDVKAGNKSVAFPESNLREANALPRNGACIPDATELENVWKANNESEDDMFCTQNITFLEANASNSNLKTFNSHLCDKSKNDCVENAAAKCDVQENSKSEFDIEDYNWNEDFKVSTEPIENADGFINGSFSWNSPEASQKRNSVGRTDNSFRKQQFNFSSPLEKSRNKLSGMSISKKLASVKRCSFVRNVDDDDNFGADFMVDKPDIVNLDELETSRFFDKPTNSNRGSPSNNANINRKAMETTQWKSPNRNRENFGGFVAPNNYCQPKSKGSQKKDGGSDKQVKHRKVNRKRNSGRKEKNVFIADEAEVSSDYSTDESSGEDTDLADFVSYTQQDHDTSDMQAHYLRSIRSPIHKPNFFPPRRERASDISSLEIYSQVNTSQAEMTYLYDSFCVPEGDESCEESEDNEVSMLDQLERRLSRKRKRSVEECSRGSKRTGKKRGRRKILNVTGSSEDETEQLRKQIKDESFMLK